MMVCLPFGYHFKIRGQHKFFQSATDQVEVHIVDRLMESFKVPLYKMAKSLSCINIKFNRKSSQ